MPRANRYFIKGQIWHITHRCHNRDFLFKFQSDRIYWIRWLYFAKKRFDITILNYIITSNHIHLLLTDKNAGRNISGFMQLLQGRIAQDYNLRKNRKGAFWEDRYHATAVESGEHTMKCMIYISMNMVRAGVVDHPILWKESGYYEIQNPKMRYTIIDYPSLLKILNRETMHQLQIDQQQRINEILEKETLMRDKKWTEAVAVGSVEYLESIRQQLDLRAKNRTISEAGQEFKLAESEIPYNNNFGRKMTF
jgi:putative transposase